MRVYPPRSLSTLSSLRLQLQQLLSFAPRSAVAVRRSPADVKRGAATAATDVENRRQLVADTLQLLHQRESRVQDAELCVSSSYMFFTSIAQELSARFKERNALQGPMEDEIKAASSLAVKWPTHAVADPF
jgi:hypothetical protein